jgi:hypothetical protein
MTRGAGHDFGWMWVWSSMILFVEMQALRVCTRRRTSCSTSTAQLSSLGISAAFGSGSVHYALKAKSASGPLGGVGASWQPI